MTRFFISPVNDGVDAYVVLDDDSKRDEEYLAVEHGVVDGVPLVLSQGRPVNKGANSCALVEIFLRVL